MKQHSKNKNIDNKQFIINALALTLKEYRFKNKKSQFMFASENDISISIISMIERGLKDPQLTTIFKLAEACNVDIIEFMQKIVENLPKDFSIIEK